jgi:hypothetical protein
MTRVRRPAILDVLVHVQQLLSDRAETEATHRALPKRRFGIEVFGYGHHRAREGLLVIRF